MKSDTSVRQGSYKKWSFGDKSKVEGYYKHGAKDSIWSFYDGNGHIEQKYDYTNKKLLYQKDYTNGKPKKSQIIKGTDTISDILEQNPVYIGGITELYKSISGYVQDKTPRCDTNGVVYIIFTIGANGKTYNYKVVGQAHCLNMKTLEAFKKIQDGWIPGVLNGEKVNVLVYVPFHFDL